MTHGEKKITGIADNVSQPDHQYWASHVGSNIRTPVLVGCLTLALFGGAFGVWAASAPLSGAALARGYVAAQGKNLIVQHFEGGIIDKILTKEGDVVTKGEPLLKLENTAALANRNRLANRLVALQARAARLQAESTGNKIVTFSDELSKDAGDQQLGAELQEQSQEFEKRLYRHTTEQNIVDQKLVALKEQVSGYRAQKSAVERQIVVLKNDIKRKSILLKKGLTNRSSYNLLRRNVAELEGRLGGLQAEIGRTHSAIVEARETKLQLNARREETAAVSLNRVRSEITDTRERLRSASDVLTRTIVRSPANGIVVELLKNTPGSVVRSGDAIVKILPTLDELVVEVRISPRDIDVVRTGLPATLRFASFNQRTTPQVPAKVAYISADRLIDPVTRESYYTAKLKISNELPGSLEKKNILPGMPVEAYIKTGERTFFSYLSQPFYDSFNRAFKEE